FVWRAIEDAAYAPGQLSGSKTAIFAGMSVPQETTVRENENTIDGYGAIRNVASLGPNRISYPLNLRGPSEPVETAWSSSLVAIHRSVMALRAGECSLAIAGGVNTIVSPLAHISFSKAGMLSADGRCKTFSAQADGYGRGEGVGMLVLKLLRDA